MGCACGRKIFIIKWLRLKYSNKTSYRSKFILNMQTPSSRCDGAFSCSDLSITIRAELIRNADVVDWRGFSLFGVLTRFFERFGLTLLFGCELGLVRW